MLKGMKKSVGIFLLLCILLMGCSARVYENNIAGHEIQSVTSGSEGDEPDLSSVDATHLSENELQENEFSTNQIIHYVYETLQEDEKKLYDEILEALLIRKQLVKVSTLNVDELNRIFNCVMADHPELFYVDGYQYTKYSVGSIITKIVFYGNYVFSEEEIAAYQKQVTSAINEIISSIPQSCDDYQKVKAVYEYIISRTEYSLGADNNQNILSVLLQHKSVCQGYAKTFQFILQQMGMECVLITGRVNDDGHAWNIVKVNDAYYHIDVTWGDASYVLSDTTQQMDIPPINYDYMLVTDQEIAVTHQVEESFCMPVCNSVKDNYFVREGLLIEEYNIDELREVFDRAYERDWKYITLKAYDEEVYRNLTGKLIDKQKIFELLKEQTKKIAYIENPDQRTISFWL